MADALISPAVGGAFWATSAGAVAWSARKVNQRRDDRLLPMMGVLGAFVFAAQMINFSLPGTGSSGHLGGGLILAILLGPHAALLVITSILSVQALFFADGGLLALGCNVFNIGVIPTLIAYPLVYCPIIQMAGLTRSWLAAMAAALLATQLGALGVVAETMFSGISSLPLAPFAILMHSIHLPIGIVEGLATAAVVRFVAAARPELVANAGPGGMRRLLVLMIGLLVLSGATWFASTRPDGLEWSVSKVTGSSELPAPDKPIYQQTSRIQDKTAILPDYQLPANDSVNPPLGQRTERNLVAPISGIIGGIITLFICMTIGWVLKERKPMILGNREALD